MFATFSHYQVGSRFSSTVDAAAEALQLVYTTELKPIAQETIAFYTTPEAKALYRFMGKAALAAISLVAYAAFFSGIKCREWVDAYVQQCLTELPTEAEQAMEAVLETAIADARFKTIAVIWAVERQLQLRARMVMTRKMAQVAWVELLAMVGDRVVWKS